jgi:hypothetical protein
MKMVAEYLERAMQFEHMAARNEPRSKGVIVEPSGSGGLSGLGSEARDRT